MKPLTLDSEQDAFGSAQGFITDLLHRQSEPRALDAGCGQNTLLDLGQDTYIVGIDISPDEVVKNTRVNESVVGDVQEHKFPGGSFDLIVCWNVLEHLSRPEKALLRFSEAIRPEGLVVLGFPHVRSLKALVAKFTPHGFHRWVFRRLRILDKEGNQREPFPTYLRSTLLPSTLLDVCHDYGLNVRLLATYEGYVQRTMRERVHLENRRWRIVETLIRTVSFGYILADVTDCVVVLERRDISVPNDSTLGTAQ
jgi:SAM-dependent methyltransferase